MTIAASTGSIANFEDVHFRYEDMLVAVSDQFQASVGAGFAPLFTTDATGLWDLYLGSFEHPAERQHHNCRTCRRFIEAYGGLATIDEHNQVRSALWPAASPMRRRVGGAHGRALEAMEKAVRRARITGVFLSPESTWGTPTTGPWRHLAVWPPAALLHQSSALSASQAIAAKKENFLALERALREFDIRHIEKAFQLLKSGALPRHEKLLGPATFFRDLKQQRAAAHHAEARNIIWKAVATAPDGFCHVRSSVLGTLLVDIACGKSFEQLSRSFAARVDPTIYQRPQVAPSAGAVAAAEALVERLGSAGSLHRRYARIDELQTCWRPAPPKESTSPGGVFGHLLVKQPQDDSLDVPPQVITWAKFERDVLPTAERLEVHVRSVGNYVALTTAAFADAPPILQWDQPGQRNPFSHYCWTGGARALDFGLTPVNSFHAVEAITFKPHMWHGGYEHFGNGVIFIIAGAHETKECGSALFPEILKSEYHGIRAVLEHHSRSRNIAGLHEPHAAGLLFSGAESQSVHLKAWTGGQGLGYVLDRWE